MNSAQTRKGIRAIMDLPPPDPYDIEAAEAMVESAPLLPHPNYLTHAAMGLWNNIGNEQSALAHALVRRDYAHVLIVLDAWAPSFNAMMDDPALVGTAARDQMVSVWRYWMGQMDCDWSLIDWSKTQRREFANAVARGWRQSERV